MSKIFLILGLIIFDQISKYYAVLYLALHDPVRLFPGLNVTLVYNFGAAFGFLSRSAGWQRWFFIAAGVCVLGVVWVYLKNPKVSRIERLGLYCLIAGAIGNILDRVFRGYVIDFIDVYYHTWHWPAFNIADIAITCAAGLLIYAGIYEKKTKY